MFSLRLMIGLVTLLWVYAEVARTEPRHINPGDSGLVYSALQIGSDTVESYRINGIDTSRTSTIITTIQRVRYADQVGDTSRPLGLKRITIQNISARGDTSVSTTEVDSVSLGLFSQRVRARTDSGLVGMTSTGVLGWIVPRGETLTYIDQPRTDVPFPDDGASPWIIRCLPFETDSVITLSVYNMWKRAEQPIEYRRLGLTLTPYHGEETRCWRIQVIGRGGPPDSDYIAWLSTDDRNVIQSAYISRSGGSSYWSRLR